MIIEQIGNRGFLFTFEPEDSPLKGTTSVYLINAENKLFLCDTHISPSSMVWINQFIEARGLEEKELVVFNTHADWDHVWGNGAFLGSQIIGHKLCKDRMEEEMDYVLEKYKNSYNDGMVTTTLPNKIFKHKLVFEEEGLEFIHAPGHTIDSSICIDHKDSVIFLGDLLEEPFPVLNHYDLDQYIRTLEFIKTLNKDTLITSHSGVAKDNLLSANLNYIKHVKKNMYDLKDDPDYGYNIKNPLIVKYVDIAKDHLGEEFDYKTFKYDFFKTLGIQPNELDKEHLHIKTIPYDELEHALKKYVDQLI